MIGMAFYPVYILSVTPRRPIALPARLCYNHLQETKGGFAVPNKKKRLLQAGLLALAAGLIIVGAYSGEAQLVFAKATRICMECIGLG